MAKTKTNPALSTDALKPYVQRAMTDPELREDLLADLVAARGIYGQMAKGRGLKGKAEKVSEKDFQKQIQHLYNPWTGQATRDWIMEQIAGGNGDGLEELEAELAADADAVQGGNGSEP